LNKFIVVRPVMDGGPGVWIYDHGPLNRCDSVHSANNKILIIYHQELKWRALFDLVCAMDFGIGMGGVY